MRSRVGRRRRSSPRNHRFQLPRTAANSKICSPDGGLNSIGGEHPARCWTVTTSGWAIEVKCRDSQLVGVKSEGRSRTVQQLISVSEGVQAVIASDGQDAWMVEKGQEMDVPSRDGCSEYHVTRALRQFSRKTELAKAFRDSGSLILHLTELASSASSSSSSSLIHFHYDDLFAVAGSITDNGLTYTHLRLKSLGTPDKER